MRKEKKVTPLKLKAINQSKNDRIFLTIIIIYDFFSLLLTIIAFAQQEFKATCWMLVSSMLFIILQRKMLQKTKKKEVKQMNTTILKYQKRLTQNPDVTKLKKFTTTNGTDLFAKTIYKKEPVPGYYAIIRRDPNRTSVPVKQLNSPLGMEKFLVLATTRQSTPSRNIAEEKLANLVFEKAKHYGL